MKISPWPYFDQNDISTVSGILSSGKVNRWTGSECELFENEFSSYFQADLSIAVANGSLALTLAYRAIGLTDGDEIITTPRTFIATSSCAVLLGAKPIFADVDPDSGCITAETIEPLITPRTKAISVVHLGGWPADMRSISALAKNYQLSVVEDCAQAHGALIDGKPVGTFSDISSWSFCQDKIMTTAGEGGMVSTSNKDLWDFMWSFKDHGKTFDACFHKVHPPGFRWLHERFGSNYRLTEIQSAIGRLQLNHLPDWTKSRTHNALFLARALSGISSVRVPLPPEHLTHAWYKFYAFVEPDSLLTDWSRDRILQEINALGFPALSGSCSEIYLEKCFQDSSLAPPSRLPVARALGETSLMFLVHPTITTVELSNYADCIRRVLLRALR